MEVWADPADGVRIFFETPRSERAGVYRLAHFVSLSRPNIFSPSSGIVLVFQSFCYRTIADQLEFDWMAG